MSDWRDAFSAHLDRCEAIRDNSQWPPIDTILDAIEPAQRRRALARMTWELQDVRAGLSRTDLSPEEVISRGTNEDREYVRELLSLMPVSLKALDVRVDARCLVSEQSGYGRVYRWRDPVFGGDRAVKILDPNACNAAGENEPLWHAIREARLATIAANCEPHPHIVSVRDYGLIGDEPAIIMEWLDGGSLSKAAPLKGTEAALGSALDHIASQWGMTPDRFVLYMLRDIACALAACHDNEVVHRDVKPGNILLRGQPIAGQLPQFVLSDFGSSGHLHKVSPTSVTGTLHGTPVYMSPEQVFSASRVPFLNKNVDVWQLYIGVWDRMHRKKPGRERYLPTAQWDIYALGCVGYHLLAGRPPFIGSREQVMDCKRMHNAPSLRDICPNAPGCESLHAIIHKCVQRFPEDRYTSAKEILEDCERLLRGATVQAKPVGRLKRVSNWIRLRPRSVSIVAAATTLLAVVGGVFLFAAYSQRGSQLKNAQMAQNASAELAQVESNRAKRLAARNVLNKAQLAQLRGELVEARVRLDSIPKSDRTLEWSLLDNLVPVSLPLRYPPGEQDFGSSKPTEIVVGENGGSVQLVSIVGSGSVLAYNERTGEATVIAQHGVSTPLPEPILNDLQCIDTSPKGLIAAVTRDFAKIVVWESASGREVSRLPVIGRQISNIALHPDGGSMAIVHSNRVVNVISLVNGETVAVQVDAQWNPSRPMDSSLVRGVEFTPDGKYLLVAMTKSIQCFAAGDWRLAWSVALKTAGPNPMSPVDWMVSPNSNYLLVAYGMPLVSFTTLDIPTGRVVDETVDNGLWGEPHLAWNRASDRWIAMAQGVMLNRSVVQSDARGVANEVQKSDAFGSWIAATLDVDASRAFLGTESGSVRVVDLQDGVEVLSFRMHTKPLTSVVWAAESRQLLAASNDGKSWAWSATQHLDESKAK